MEGLRLEMDGIDGNFERRLEPEKAAGPGESLTEGIMASSLPTKSTRNASQDQELRHLVPGSIRPSVRPAQITADRQQQLVTAKDSRRGGGASDIWWAGRAGDCTARPLGI